MPIRSHSAAAFSAEPSPRPQAAPSTPSVLKPISMKTTEASENTTWIGSVARGRSTRRVSSALVPSAMHAYWLPDAGSSDDDAAQVSPSS